MRRNKTVGKIKALERGWNIIFVLAESGIPLSLSELSSRSFIPITTIYRYVQTLESFGLLEETPEGYRLGLRFLELAESVRRNIDFVGIARPIMAELSMTTQEAVVLAALREDFAVWVDKVNVNSQQMLGISCVLGKRQFLHAGASGKAIMAYLSESRQKQVIQRAGMPRFTDRTVTDWQELREQLQQIRSDGVAISTGEVDPGVTAVAAPLFKPDGQVWGSLSVVGPEYRLKGERLEFVVKEVKRAASRLNTLVKSCGVEE